SAEEAAGLIFRNAGRGPVPRAAVRLKQDGRKPPTRPGGMKSEHTRTETRTKKKNGSLYGSGLQALPPRGAEAVPEGNQVLHGEVSGGAAELSAGPARHVAVASSQDVGVLAAAP